VNIPSTRRILKFLFFRFYRNSWNRLNASVMATVPDKAEAFILNQYKHRPHAGLMLRSLSINGNRCSTESGCASEELDLLVHPVVGYQREIASRSTCRFAGSVCRQF
jgi:hypothetical protein